MTPDEDTLNTPAILAKQRARISELEAALMAALNANDLLLEQRNEARAACDALAANVDRIAKQRDEARRDYEAESVERADMEIQIASVSAALSDMTLQRNALLNAAKWGSSRLAVLDPINEYDGSNQLFEAVLYCEQLSAPDRAIDAQEQAGRMAAEDEAALRYGG